MRRLAAIIMLFAAVGLFSLSARSTADASCNAVLADLPVLTDPIQTEWVVDTCNAKTQVRVTLSELVGGDWQRADCLNGDCTTVKPGASENSDCDPFYCAYATVHRTSTWNQDDGPCTHTWRTKVTVLNRDGDVIAQDTSPGNTC
jgi:hypothetical protein